MAPGLGDGRGCEGLAPLYPYWEGAGQYLESDLLCSEWAWFQVGNELLTSLNSGRRKD